MEDRIIYLGADEPIAESKNSLQKKSRKKQKKKEPLVSLCLYKHDPLDLVWCDECSIKVPLSEAKRSAGIK